MAPDPPGTVALIMDSFTLQPNQEVYRCQNFDNPFGGKDTAVQRFVGDMAQGSHHLHVYHMTEGTSRTIEDCSFSDFHPLIFGSAQPHLEMQYKEGMAVKVLGSQGLRIQVHYLNTRSEALQAQAVVKLSPVDASTVTKWVSELYLNRVGLQIPVGMQSVATTCSIASNYGPIGIVGSYAHMHKRGTRFTAKTSTGVTLIDVNDWEAAPVVNDPPVMLQPGESITWTCSYNNDTGGTLTFGESAQTNEMCIYLGRFFSAPDEAQMECDAQSGTGMTTVRANYNGHDPRERIDRNL
jgi:hypothetical protein